MSALFYTKMIFSFSYCRDIFLYDFRIRFKCIHKLILRAFYENDGFNIDSPVKIFGRGQAYTGVESGMPHRGADEKS